MTDAGPKPKYPSDPVTVRRLFNFSDNIYNDIRPLVEGPLGLVGTEIDGGYDYAEELAHILRAEGLRPRTFPVAVHPDGSVPDLPAYARWLQGRDVFAITGSETEGDTPVYLFRAVDRLRDRVEIGRFTYVNGYTRAIVPETELRARSGSMLSAMPPRARSEAVKAIGDQLRAEYGSGRIALLISGPARTKSRMRELARYLQEIGAQVTRVSERNGGPKEDTIVASAKMPALIRDGFKYRGKTLRLVDL